MSQASVVSDSFTVEHTPIVCIQANWSGVAPVGVIQLQGSIDGSNYFDVGSSVAVSGNSGSKCVNDDSAGYLFARLKYTKTSGTGSIDAFASAKGF